MSIDKLNMISNKYHKSLEFLAGMSRSDNIQFVEKDLIFEDIGKILKNERKKQGISQEQLAQKLNVDRTTISLYERGKSLTIPILIQYAIYFDRSIDYLCGKTDK